MKMNYNEMQIKWFKKIDNLRITLPKKDYSEWNKVEIFVTKNINELEFLVKSINQRISTNILSPSAVWNDILKRMVRLIGLNSISLAYQSIVSINECLDESQQFSNEFIERLTAFIDNIKDRNQPLEFYVKFQSITIYLDVDRSTKDPYICNLKYMIDDKQIDLDLYNEINKENIEMKQMKQIKEVKEMKEMKEVKEINENQTKVSLRLKAYKSFFDEIIRIVGMNEIQFHEDPNEMIKLAKQLMNSKEEIQQHLDENQILIEQLGEQIVEYDEIIKEKNNEMKQIQIQHQQKVKQIEQSYKQNLLHQNEEFIQLQKERDEMNLRLCQCETLLIQNDLKKYNKMINGVKLHHSKQKIFYENNEEHVFIDNNALNETNEEILQIPCIIRVDCINEFIIQFNEINKNELLQHQKMILEKKGSKLYGMKEQTNVIIEVTNDITLLKQINQQNIHFKMITIPLKFIMIGCEYQVVDENTNQHYTIEIPKGILENQIIQVTETFSVIIKYEENEKYKRKGNDLHGYFTYGKQYENQKIQPEYILGGYLPYEIDVLDNYCYTFNDFGFIDMTTGKCGNYIIYIKLVEK